MQHLLLQLMILLLLRMLAAVVALAAAAAAAALDLQLLPLLVHRRSPPVRAHSRCYEAEDCPAGSCMLEQSSQTALLAMREQHPLHCWHRCCRCDRWCGTRCVAHA
jgi:hypothetical protein